MSADVVRSRVFPATYRDSVELMRVAAEVERLPGMRRAALLVGTPANRDLLTTAGLLDDTAGAAGSADLIVAVAAESEEAAQAALAHADRLLTTAPAVGTGTAERRPPPTIAAALDELVGANLALISTPGPYATAEALKALKRGLHVFLFSDNVPVDDEIELKRLAVKKGLLVMGPDCGTAILDGVPLGFANAVRRGRIGLVAASGTGLQQVVCLVERQGEGISQAIGVGGHDLSERVGGLMMLAGIERLLADPGTAVIVLVSKPPSAAVARRVLERAAGGAAPGSPSARKPPKPPKPPKPVVVCFLGGDPSAIRSSGATPAATLEEAARLAVALARGRSPAAPGGWDEDADLWPVAQKELHRLAPAQRAIRGLYSGGTLCSEASLILTHALGVPLAAGGHTLVDLGDDEFTVGRPHPMIDFRLRNERIVAAAEDPATAVVLLDVVLGYGSHADPAGALAPAIEEARSRAVRAGRHLLFVGSVCGTAADPQDLTGQEARLRAIGVLLASSNAQAARLAARIVGEARKATGD